MKSLIAILAMFVAGTAWSAAQPAPAETVLKGEVLEVKDVDSYSYLRIKTADGESWAAVGKAPLKKGAKVTIRAKVVKFSPMIMGKNWVHLRDGTGSAADKTDDLLVTTMDQAKVGDVVLVKGTVRTDKDFGAGYSYKVLVEEATLGQ
jgi:hypothetical protein